MLTSFSLSGIDTYMTKLHNSTKINTKNSWAEIFWIIQFICFFIFTLINIGNFLIYIFAALVYVMEVFLLLISSYLRATHQIKQDLKYQIFKVLFDAILFLIYFLFFTQNHMYIIFILMFLNRLSFFLFLRDEVKLISFSFKKPNFSFKSIYRVKDSLRISVSSLLVLLSSRVDLMIVPLFGPVIDNYTFAFVLRTIGIINQIIGGVFQKNLPTVVNYFYKRQWTEYNKVIIETRIISALLTTLLYVILFLIVQFLFYYDKSNQIVNVDFNFMAYVLLFVFLDLSLGPTFGVLNAINRVPNLFVLFFWFLFMFLIGFYLINTYDKYFIVFTLGFSFIFKLMYTKNLKIIL
jgi:hypothetical protein